MTRTRAFRLWGPRRRIGPPVVGTHPSHLRDYEYVRLGTVSLLAGLDLHSGRVIETLRDTHKSADFIAFLKRLDSAYPEHPSNTRTMPRGIRVASKQELIDRIHRYFDEITRQWCFAGSTRWTRPSLYSYFENDDLVHVPASRVGPRLGLPSLHVLRLAASSSTTGEPEPPAL